MSLEQAAAQRDRQTPFPKVWLLAAFRPSVETYRRIAEHAPASLRPALAWVILGGFVSAAISLIRHFLREGEQGDAGLTLGHFIAVQVIAATAVLGWILLSLGVQAAARLSKGTGRYRELAHVFAACYVPLIVFGSIIAEIGANLFVASAVYVYSFVIYAIATRAVHRISGLRAAVSVLLSFFVLGSVIPGLVSLSAAF